MQELVESVAEVIRDGLGEPSEEVAKEIVDVIRDAGWLPPDEVRNESADLQLAAMALVKALQDRLVTQSYPPLDPLVVRLAEAMLPYLTAGDDPRTAEDAKALKGGPSGPLMW